MRKVTHCEELRRLSSNTIHADMTPHALDCASVSTTGGCHSRKVTHCEELRRLSLEKGDSL